MTDSQTCHQIFELWLLCTLSLTQATVYRRSLEAYPQALCNDGTQGVYYKTIGSGEGSNFVIHLEWGGYCTNVDSCVRRCESNEHRCTTSDDMERNISGILSDDRSENPHFHDWFKAHLHYCTSDLHTGNRTASLETGGFYFRGKEMVLAMIKDLKENFGLGTGGEVILTGSSAGGAGVSFECQEVRDLLPGTRVSCIPDAAFFYPSIPPFSEECQPFEDVLEEGNDLWNGGNEDFDLFSWWEDFDLPLLIGIHMWDTFGIETAYCGSRDDPDHLREWGIGTMELIEEVSHAHPGIAMFIPGCVAHGLITNNDHFTGLLVNGSSYSDVIATWILDGKSEQVYDQCNPDDVENCNPTCP